MVDQASDYWDTPTVEVRIYRHGELVATELCESESDATDAVERWTSEFDDVTCTVDDLTVRHQPGDVFEPDPAVGLDD